jgi:23S rRNA (uracil1939-C5)-methyltransferase
MVAPGELLTLTIEKPAAGGRMVARTNGQIVLVGGAIPGETVTAKVGRIARGVVYADAVSIDAASADRREPPGDPLCGGCLYAHIAYPRQLEIKAQVITDAFARIGRTTLAAPVTVAPSIPHGYRMRARLHVRGARIGFFREASHELCDPRTTRQLLPATCDVLDRISAALEAYQPGSGELELSESIDASGRVVHLDLADAPQGLFRPLSAIEGLTGLALSCRSPATAARHEVTGTPYVHDAIALEKRTIVWRRHVLAFFQGNRYVLPALVSHVVGRIEPGSRVIDLYAGTGLFSVPAAVMRQARVVAVEGDRLAALDLEENARQTEDGVHVMHAAVEEFVAGRPARADVLVVDPPRTGMSLEALGGVAGLGARRLIYVGCDVATLARDARRLLDRGYRLERVDAFDMFPNTPHVETVAEFSAYVA